MSSYELRTLKDGRWMIEERSSDRDSILIEARERVGSKSFQGVSVIEESYDESLGVYKERVIFKHGESESAKSSRAGGPASAKAGGRKGDPFAGGGGAYSKGDFDMPEIEVPEQKSIFSIFKSKKKKK